MTEAKLLKPIAPYQRLSVKDVEETVALISAAAMDDDHEIAHQLEDELYFTVIQKLAHRGSAIAKAALVSKQIKFARRMT